jgi:polyadenylate-binding protein
VNDSALFGFEVHPYAPKDRRDMRKIFNNIYLKNFPNTWTKEHLVEMFSKYGDIKSCEVMKAKRSDSEVESSFAFICFERDGDREHGIEAAIKAVDQEHGKTYEGHEIYVQEALKKEDRETEKRREQLRFKNSKKRCNLYVKNFPPNTKESELTEFFSKYGEIESVKVFPNEENALYAFVCFKSPDHAALAKLNAP